MNAESYSHQPHRSAPPAHQRSEPREHRPGHIVSGDSDLEPAVEWLRRNRPAVEVTVYIPTLPTQAQQRRNDFYLRIGVTCRPLPPVDIPRHQFPPTITLPNGTTTQKPADRK